eukprot:8032466-Ditylum_brightwellii.AAC.1
MEYCLSRRSSLTRKFLIQTLQLLKYLSISMQLEEVEMHKPIPRKTAHAEKENDKRHSEKGKMPG